MSGARRELEGWRSGRDTLSTSLRIQVQLSSAQGNKYPGWKGGGSPSAIPELRGQRQEIPKVSWLGRLAGMVGSGFN